MFKRILPILLLAATTAMAQQVPPYGEKVDVNLVQLDAVVTDTHGHQILGLDKSDFVVRENGVPQTIDSVDYFTNRTLLDEPENKAPFKAEQIHEQRYFIFFFDKPTDNAAFFDRLNLARRAAHEFVDHEMKPADFVAIVAHDVRLKVYSDFTQNRKQLDKAIDETAMYGKGLTAAQAGPTGPSILRNATDNLIDQTGTVYEALQYIGDATRSIHARKNVALFTAAIFAPGEEIHGGMVIGTSRYYDPMVRSLNRANVTVYPISLLEDPNHPMYIDQTPARIAADTNGEYFRMNTSFTPALRRIEEQTNGYYLISYYTSPKSGSGYQKVQVALKNPEFKIRARQGYAY